MKMHATFFAEFSMEQFYFVPCEQTICRRENATEKTAVKLKIKLRSKLNFLCRHHLRSSASSDAFEFMLFSTKCIHVTKKAESVDPAAE